MDAQQIKSIALFVDNSYLIFLMCRQKVVKYLLVFIKKVEKK